MKCEIEIELEDIAKELVNHIDMDDLAKEISGKIDTDEIKIDYYDLASEINYSDLASEINYSDLEVDYHQLVDAMGDNEDLVEKLAESNRITELVNRAIESKLEEIAQAIASKVEKKDVASLKEAITAALAAL